MSRFIAALALGCGLAVAANAQDTKTTTTTKSTGGEVKTVSYTGCVQTGTETRSYVLNKVMPVSRTSTSEAVGTSGTVTTTTTSYELVPAGTVEFQQHVGHKVEVTGMMIPAGESKTKTETKIEREGDSDSKTSEKSKTKSDTPQFRVTAIRDLGEPCQ